MQNRDRDVDPEFIAKPRQRSTKVTPLPLPTASAKATSKMQTKVAAPDEFDTERIRRDLEKFITTPGIFQQYVERLYNHFTKAGEIAFIENWVKFYRKSEELVRAKTRLADAVTDYDQLTAQAEIKKKEKELRLARIEADTAEVKLRQERAEYRRRHIESYLDEPALSGALKATPDIGAPKTRTPDEEKLEALLERSRLDIEADLRQDMDKQVAAERVVEHWREEQHQAILSDRTLSPRQQREKQKRIDEYCQAKLQQIRNQVNIFKE